MVHAIPIHPSPLMKGIAVSPTIAPQKICSMMFKIIKAVKEEESRISVVPREERQHFDRLTFETSESFESSEMRGQNLILQNHDRLSSLRKKDERVG